MKKILNNIIYKIKEDSLVKRQGSVERCSEYKGLKSVRTGLIIWSGADEQAEWLEKISECLRDVKFDKLCYMPPKVTAPNPVNALIIKNEDLGFGGKILNTQLPDLLGRQYDLLIDLSTESNTLLNYVLLNSKALCKVGMNRDGGERDITIVGVSQQLEFIDKLTEVLSGIKEY